MEEAARLFSEALADTDESCDPGAAFAARNALP